MAAPMAMLDEVYGNQPVELQYKTDDNPYHLGPIGTHNVAITCLPTYGVASAATVTMQMLATSTAICVGLMVGVGGGIPQMDRDIRLGEVVISRPEGRAPGVVQYDLGKIEAGEKQ